MQDEFPHVSEYRPYWRRVDKYPPPKGVKLLFREIHGPAVSGVWYAESRWAFWCPLPAHTEEDKAWIRAKDKSTAGRFSDGKSFGVGYES